jgi:hypothetical protein
MDSYDLTIYQGSTFSEARTLNDASGVALNLSGCAVSGFLKMRYGDTGKLAAFNISITQATSGIVNIGLASNVTASLPVAIGFYDVEVYTSGTQITYKPVGGKAFVYPEATY